MRSLLFIVGLYQGALIGPQGEGMGSLRFVKQ